MILLFLIDVKDFNAPDETWYLPKRKSNLGAGGFKKKYDYRPKLTTNALTPAILTTYLKAVSTYKNKFYPVTIDEAGDKDANIPI